MTLVEGRAISFRKVLTGLAVLSLAGTVVELAAERHWETWIQRLPWVAVILLLAAAALALRSSRKSDVAVRLLSVAVIAASLFGVYEHIHANYETAPLDFRYTERWPSMSELDRWWAAASKSVGPSPPLAAGVLAQAALLLLAATLDRPRRP